MSNLIIEIEMEKFKKDTLKLAIWNLAVEVTVFIMVYCLFAGPKPAYRTANMSSFTAYLCLFFAVVLPLLYFQWFRFLKGMKKIHPDNIHINYAVGLGVIAFILLSVAFVTGLIATVFDTFIITPNEYNWTFNSNGIFPQNNVGNRCESLITGGGILLSIMYFYLCRLAEPNSTMKKLTVILALKYPVQLTVSLFISSISMAIVGLFFWIVEFLFFMQIYKGYVFGEKKPEPISEATE